MKNLKSKHTPGPFSEHKGYIFTEKNQFVADCNATEFDDVICSANAVLLSAAPEMLEALELLTKQLEYNGAKLNSNNNLYALIVKAEHAIAKAKGGV